MTPYNNLNSILNNRYESEDADEYGIELLEGFNESELEEFRSTLPNKYLPSEIEELLKLCRGFEFYGLEEIRFDTFGHFGFEEAFPYSILLAGDGFGNFWIQDIDSKGNWNEIYYVCHDPAVIVKHSKSLAEFILHVDEFGKMEDDSHLNLIHDQVVFDIWNQKTDDLMQSSNDHKFDPSIELPESYLVADLKGSELKAGFAWGKSGPSAKIIRPGDDPLWIVEKKNKKGFFSRLFNK